MRHIISFMHVSLDGFVAGPNGEMNWIKIDAELFAHVGKRIGLGDTSMYGRKTYDMMEGYWPDAGKAPDASEHDKNHSAWYAGVHKVVLSNSLKGAELPQTTIVNDNMEQHIRSIKEKGDKEILLFGSPTATHALMKQGLIDGYWLFVNPVVLGEGIPLFNGDQPKAPLELVNTRTFSSGVTELDYRVKP